MVVMIIAMKNMVKMKSTFNDVNIRMVAVVIEVQIIVQIIQNGMGHVVVGVVVVRVVIAVAAIVSKLIIEIILKMVIFERLEILVVLIEKVVHQVKIEIFDDDVDKRIQYKIVST